MSYVASMLHAVANKKKAITPAPVKAKRDTSKAREARKAQTREWFNTHLNSLTLTTPEIAAKRGQDSSSCLCTLYALEEEGFLIRAGEGERTGRGKKPVLWKLANPQPNLEAAA